MGEILFEDILSELVYDELEASIPNWFDEYEAGLLTTALEAGDLDDELEKVVNLLESKVLPEMKNTVKKVFCGERIRFAGEEDIGDKAVEILRKAVVNLDDDIDARYKDKQDEIQRLWKRLNEARAALKKMTKPPSKE